MAKIPEFAQLKVDSVLLSGPLSSLETAEQSIKDILHEYELLEKAVAGGKIVYAEERKTPPLLNEGALDRIRQTDNFCSGDVHNALDAVLISIKTAKTALQTAMQECVRRTMTAAYKTLEHFPILKPLNQLNARPNSITIPMGHSIITYYRDLSDNQVKYGPRLQIIARLEFAMKPYATLHLVTENVDEGSIQAKLQAKYEGKTFKNFREAFVMICNLSHWAERGVEDGFDFMVAAPNFDYFAAEADSVLVKVLFNPPIKNIEVNVGTTSISVGHYDFMPAAAIADIAVPATVAAPAAIAIAAVPS